MRPATSTRPLTCRPAAASEYEAAGSLVSFGQTLFVKVVLQLNAPSADQVAEIDTVDFPLRNMTEEGEAVVTNWFGNDLDLPLTDACYDSFYAPADDLVREAEAEFEESSINNTNGDKYVLVNGSRLDSRWTAQLSVSPIVHVHGFGRNAT